MSGEDDTLHRRGSSARFCTKNAECSSEHSAFIAIYFLRSELLFSRDNYDHYDEDDQRKKDRRRNDDRCEVYE